MKQDRKEFGSNTVNHVSQTEVGNAHLMRELTGLKTVLEDLLDNAGTCLPSPMAHSRTGTNAARIEAQVADWGKQEGRTDRLWTTSILH
jgi:hypothetical protein